MISRKIEQRNKCKKRIGVQENLLVRLSIFREVSRNIFFETDAGIEHSEIISFRKGEKWIDIELCHFREINCELCETHQEFFQIQNIDTSFTAYSGEEREAFYFTHHFVDICFRKR